MTHFVVEGKIQFIKALQTASGHYRTVVMLLKKDNKRNKTQKYYVTCFDNVAFELACTCDRNDYIRITGELNNNCYKTSTGVIKDELQLIGHNFEKIYWSNDDKRFLPLTID